MKNRYILIAALLLAACNGGAEPMDAQKFLAGLEGPKVPSIQDTMMESAKNAEKQGDFKTAAQIYQQILEKHPDDKNAAIALADCYRRSGAFDQALAIYDGLLAKDPSMAAAKEGKGLALLAKGDFDTPGPIFESVLKAEPNRWKTLNGLGILFTTRNLQPEAQQYFQAALKNSPGNPSVLNNLGLSQALDRHFNPAIATLAQAADAAGPGTADRKRIDLNMALVYAVAGRLDDSRAIAEHYFTGAELDNNLGLYAHLAKDDQLAKTYLNMALTDSKVFYEKAWDNLQQIDGGGSDGASVATPRQTLN